MKNLLRKGIFILIGIFLAVPVFGFPGDPDGGDDPLPPIDPVPIDNYLLVLISVALIIGIYFMVKSKRKSIV